MAKYYTIYQITNKLDGKIYIGQHQTNDLNDSYLGSGKVLIEDQIRLGRDNFVKENLYVFDNPVQMVEKEAELVDKAFVERRDTYNLCCGGPQGPFQTYNMNFDPDGEQEQARRRKISQTLIKNGVCPPPHSRLPSEARKKASRARIARDGHCWIGRIHRDETKLKISVANTISQMGSRNSQYGTRWITHPDFGNRKISKDEPIPEGWVAGRKIK